MAFALAETTKKAHLMEQVAERLLISHEGDFFFTMRVERMNQLKPEKNAMDSLRHTDVITFFVENIQ